VTERYTGFGCPDTVDPHHMRVLIPPGRSDEVSIVEDFGLRGGSNGVPERVERCRLPRALWSALANTVKQAFNERLKEKEIPPGRWIVGENRLDRLLGKELCVLAWGVESASEALVPNALRNWLALSPEERWWLFSKAVAGTGLAEHVDLGWRKAIRVALTEVGDEVPAATHARKRGRVERDDPQTALFDALRRASDGK
jgi:hypothetical protein